MSYRDDVTGLRARTAELERELAEYRATGATATDVRVEELTLQRANLTRLARPYLWLLLEPLAWLIVHSGALDAASAMDRLAVVLLPPVLAVAHLAHALQRQSRAARLRCAQASAAERAHAATMSAEARQRHATAALEAEIREIGHALTQRREALVRHNAGPGAVPVVLLVFSAVAAALGTGGSGQASGFELAWTAVAVLGFVGFLLGVASLAARVGLADETPAALRGPSREKRPREPREPRERQRELACADVAPPAAPQLTRLRNDYALELARHEALEAELASYRHTGKSGPAMRLLETTREVRAVASRWQPFTWLAFEVALVALARTHALPLSVLDALLVPPGVVLAAFALHAAGQAVTLHRRLAFALSERSAFAAAGARSSSRVTAGAEIHDSGDRTGLAVRAREAEERDCARALRAGTRERRTSLVLFVAAVGAFLASIGSLSPRAGAHGAMVLGMVIGVSVLTALAALGFLAFAMVQVVHRRRLLAIARLATLLERKKVLRLEHARVAVAEARLRVEIVPEAAPSAPDSLEDVESATEASEESAALARHFA